MSVPTPPPSELAEQPQALVTACGSFASLSKTFSLDSPEILSLASFPVLVPWARQPPVREKWA